MMDLILVFIAATLYLGFGCMLMAAVQKKISVFCVVIWPVILLCAMVYAFIKWCINVGRRVGNDVRSDEKGEER